MTGAPENPHSPPTAPVASPAKPQCGIVMPISQWDGLPASHWAEVLRILREAIEPLGFDVKLVSEAAETGVIQRWIVQNLALNPIVVCDISGLNPNVMLELGMRLTFDKATVIVKDDATKSPFDTSIVEYVPYQRDLRYAAILGFKEKLAEKVRATHEKGKDSSYSTFLKHFGTFTVPTIETKAGSKTDVLFGEMQDLKSMMRRLLVADAQPTKLLPASNKFSNLLEDATKTAIEVLKSRQKWGESIEDSDASNAVAKALSEKNGIMLYDPWLNAVLLGAQTAVKVP
jgi:hypothetical protein